MQWRIGVFVVWLCMGVQVVTAQVEPLSLSQQSYLRADNLGVTFVSYIEQLDADATARYRNALEIGAGWTRWPLYWYRVELSPDGFDWSAYDRLVEADRRARLRTNLILLGKPEFYRQGTSITGLYDPVFADGTDTLGAGKQINPNNRWANFVVNAVNRYKPNGILAQQNGWRPNEGITIWEAWNEPDLDIFWSGTQADYARLLKVTFLAVKSADVNGAVMFGGLAYGNPDTDDWLDAVLNIYATDPARAQYSWYMDIVAVHSYTDARRTGLVINRMQQTLSKYGLSRPIWLNETGLAVWDDYPGPTWAGGSPIDRRLRGTQQQQAAFMVQSAAYAFSAGAEKVFFHQLYDDCGNSAGNHTPDSQVVADAYGLFRNPQGYGCFSQHTSPGTPRLAAGAFQSVARLLGSGGLTGGRIVNLGDGARLILFERASAGQVISVIWTNALNDTTVSWQAFGSRGDLYGYGNESLSLVPDEEGNYTVTLPSATINDDPQRPQDQLTVVGGKTFILVERGSLNTQTVDANPNTNSLTTDLATPRATLAVDIGTVLGGVTTDSTVGSINPNDITPPTTRMFPLPLISPATFTVAWDGTDESGIEKYLIWVRVNQNTWEPWLETTRTSNPYTGESGNIYAFAVWAMDVNGNWSLNTDLQPQTVTRVE